MREERSNNDFPHALLPTGLVLTAKASVLTASTDNTHSLPTGHNQKSVQPLPSAKNPTIMSCTHL